MCIVIKSYSIRTQLQQQTNSFLKAFLILFWQTVYQVGVYRFKASGSRCKYHLFYLVIRLNTVYCLLHARVKILNTKATAVKTILSLIGQRIRIDRPRINLDTKFGIRLKLKPFL